MKRSLLILLVVLAAAAILFALGNPLYTIKEERKS